MKFIKKYKQFENKSSLLDLKDNFDFDLINIIESLSPNNILEISCGNGADAIELSNRGYDVTATDINDEYVDYVNQFIRCIQHDSRDKFPFDDKSFDLVYSRLGLHYFEKNELSKIFDEIYRITNKYFVFTVKLVNDIETGKVILTESDWIEITNEKFKIISSNVKTGILYGRESKWLEIVAKR